MDGERIRKAAEMILGGATLVAHPCPYCSGVRVIKNGRAFCVSCGSEPDPGPSNTGGPADAESRILTLTRELGGTKDPQRRRYLLKEIERLSEEMAHS